MATQRIKCRATCYSTERNWLMECEFVHEWHFIGLVFRDKKEIAQREKLTYRESCK